MARPGLAIGGLVMIGAGVVMGLGWWWPSKSDATANLDQPIRVVEIANDSGDVSVRAGDVPQTTVRQRFDFNWSKPGDSFRVDGDRLVLGDCGRMCTVDYEIVVPRGAAVTGNGDSGDVNLEGVARADVQTDSGSVHVRDVAGPVQVQADSGDVTLSAIGQDATVRTDSGAVSGEGLRGRVNVEAGSGDIALRLDVPQDVKARADNGEIALTVPRGSYRVQGDSDSGDRNINVTVDGAAAHLLDLNTDSGDVSVTAS
ncbi:DUF4097 family beta strand repeat-containing protein [Amycolatopsis nigrescens]|uniref:DUF4097 family beta strand repeat-containing protein n=1 Tax=Amycolatopsis nigrescens TaxID=381445 RepID=UPI00039B2513|nr:DUF4097 family beta strand repeat-containing protein [Amycolatopsis nigrescens]